jgi:hypothetical protein
VHCLISLSVTEDIWSLFNSAFDGPKEFQQRIPRIFSADVDARIANEGEVGHRFRRLYLMDVPPRVAEQLHRRKAMEDTNQAIEAVLKQSGWYGDRAQSNQKIFVCLKTFQLAMAAAIPVVALASSGNIERWTSAVLGALIGIVEVVLQLGQLQQNWLLFRAAREALRSEELLHSAGAGPYAALPVSDAAFVERCAAIMSGENSKWLTAKQQVLPAKQGDAPERSLLWPGWKLLSIVG